MMKTWFSVDTLLCHLTIKWNLILTEVISAVYDDSFSLSVDLIFILQTFCRQKNDPLSTLEHSYLGAEGYKVAFA